MEAPKYPKATLTLDVWELHQLHKELKSASQASKDSLRLARSAVREAETASIRSYLVLASFEAHMKELFESQGWQDFSEFVTLDKEETGE